MAKLSDSGFEFMPAGSTRVSQAEDSLRLGVDEKLGKLPLGLKQGLSKGPHSAFSVECTMRDRARRIDAFRRLNLES